MTRNTEGAFVLAGTVLASIGVAMVQFAAGIWLDSAVALTFFSFVLAFGSLHIAFGAPWRWRRVSDQSRPSARVGGDPPPPVPPPQL